MQKVSGSRTTAQLSGVVPKWGCSLGGHIQAAIGPRFWFLDGGGPAWLGQAGALVFSRDLLRGTNVAGSLSWPSSCPLLLRFGRAPGRHSQQSFGAVSGGVRRCGGFARVWSRCVRGWDVLGDASQPSTGHIDRLGHEIRCAFSSLRHLPHPQLESQHHKSQLPSHPACMQVSRHAELKSTQLPGLKIQSPR